MAQLGVALSSGHMRACSVMVAGTEESEESGVIREGAGDDAPLQNQGPGILTRTGEDLSRVLISSPALSRTHSAISGALLCPQDGSRCPISDG